MLLDSGKRKCQQNFVNKFYFFEGRSKKDNLEIQYLLDSSYQESFLANQMSQPSSIYDIMMVLFEHFTVQEWISIFVPWFCIGIDNNEECFGWIRKIWSKFFILCKFVSSLPNIVVFISRESFYLYDSAWNSKCNCRKSDVAFAHTNWTLSCPIFNTCLVWAHNFRGWSFSTFLILGEKWRHIT